MSSPVMIAFHGHTDKHSFDFEAPNDTPFRGVCERIYENLTGIDCQIHRYPFDTTRYIITIPDQKICVVSPTTDLTIREMDEFQCLAGVPEPSVRITLCPGCFHPPVPEKTFHFVLSNDRTKTFDIVVSPLTPLPWLKKEMQKNMAIIDPANEGKFTFHGFNLTTDHELLCQVFDILEIEKPVIGQSITIYRRYDCQRQV